MKSFLNELCLFTLRKGSKHVPSWLTSIAAITLAVISVSQSGCHKHEAHAQSVHHKVVVTSPKSQSVVLTQQYVCQIHSQRHIKVRALECGYLEAIPVKEGQAVKRDDVLFRVMPVLYKSKLDAELAEVELARLELNNTDRLLKDKVVSPNELALFKAKLARAEAKAKLAEAELNFATVRAPFDGIIDRLNEQHGSLVKEGDELTTLSDNGVMWVYFNVPEKQYLEYMGTSAEEKKGQRYELVLANQSTFPFAGKIGEDEATGMKYGAIEARFNNETGTVPFRADFPNPEGLLRHGMTGNVLIHKTLPNALVIPQRATFEILAKRYVFVLDKDDVVHQREIVVQNEMEDVFVIQSGIAVDDKIVFEGVGQVRDGQKVEFEFRPPEQILEHQKSHAE